MNLLADIRDYPWRSLLAGLLPARFQIETAQIVPQASIAGNALTVVIAIMSFLACLTAGAVYMINQSANAWVNDITSEITVELKRLRPTECLLKGIPVTGFYGSFTVNFQLPPLFGLGKSVSRGYGAVSKEDE